MASPTDTSLEFDDPAYYRGPRRQRHAAPLGEIGESSTKPYRPVSPTPAYSRQLARQAEAYKERKVAVAALPNCPSCGEKMLQPAPLCGLCELDEGGR